MEARTPQQAQKIEEALAALSYIGFNWDEDRTRAQENLTPLLQRYPMEVLQQGAMRALAVLMIQQAHEAQMDVLDYINTKVRPQVDPTLRPHA